MLGLLARHTCLYIYIYENCNKQKFAEPNMSFLKITFSMWKFRATLD